MEVKQRDYALAISNGVCEVCGAMLGSYRQMAHRIGNTKSNRAKFGDFIIDHRFNVGMTCSLKCNAKLDISFNSGACIKLCLKIYEFESRKYNQN